MNFFGMKASFLTILLAFAGLFLSSAPSFAQTNSQDEKTPEELAAMEADRLGAMLDLDPSQIFYVDSTLQHDYAALDKELKDMQKSKVGNTDLYISVQDKWLQQIYDTYKTIFNEDQWAKYQKAEGSRAQKARDKRREKAAGEAK